jgi:hypothetical protein
VIQPLDPRDYWFRDMLDEIDFAGEGSLERSVPAVLALLWRIPDAHARAARMEFFSSRSGVPLDELRDRAVKMWRTAR